MEAPTEEMSLARRAVKGTIWVAGASYSAFIVGFAAQLVLVRLLFPEDFGLYALAISILEPISVFFFWSFSMGLIQLEDRDRLRETAYILSFAQGLVFLLVVALTSLAVGRIHSIELAKVFVVIGLGRPLGFVANIYSSVLEKELEYTRLSMVRFAVGVASALGAIGLAYVGFGVWSLVGKDVLVAAGYFAGYRLIAPWRFRWRFDGTSAVKLLKFGWGMFFSRGLEVVYFRLDNLLVGILLGVTSLGYYSQARYLVNLGNAAVAPASTMVAFPTFSKLQGDKPRLTRAFQTTNYFLVRLLLPAALVLFLLPEPLVTLLFGFRWKPSAPILGTLSLLVFMVPIFNNLIVFLYSLAKMLQVAKVRTVQVLILLPSLFLGVRIWGAQGAAAALVLSMAVGVVFAYLYTREYTLASIAKNYTAPILSGTFSLLLGWFLTGPSTSLPLSLLIVLAPYLFGLILLEGKELSEGASLLLGREIRFKAQ